MVFSDLNVNSEPGTEFTIISRYCNDGMEWSAFRISVSAYAVTLDRAFISGEKEIDILIEALHLAKKLHAEEQQHHDAE